MHSISSPRGRSIQVSLWIVFTVQASPALVRIESQTGRRIPDLKTAQGTRSRQHRI
jgi:hypothetical protein